MNPYSGAVYPSLSDALAAGEKVENVVEVLGRKDQIDQLSADIRKIRSDEQRQADKKRRRDAKASRKKNRRK